MMTMSACILVLSLCRIKQEGRNEEGEEEEEEGGGGEEEEGE
jgi:hypothetical protein